MMDPLYSYLFFTQYLMLHNTLVLMMDPLNYVSSVDLSIDFFDGALATQGLNKPIKNGPI